MLTSGTVAAGSPYTADAGTAALAAGGNAVDAAVAAVLASTAAEPGLASLAAGGILQVLDASGGEPVMCEFFANAPGLGAGGDRDRDFYPVDCDFGPTTQTFHMGRGAAAVPGLIPGLLTAWERWGRLPLSQVVAPACRTLAEGVIIDAYQAFAARFHGPMMMGSEASRRLFAPQGHLVAEGDRFANPDAARFLEELSRAPDWHRFYRHELGERMLADFGPAAGGRLTAEDLDRYRVVFREPLQRRHRGVRVSLNPPPAAGGRLAALGLALLETQPLARPQDRIPKGSRPHLERLVAAMRLMEASRGETEDPLAAPHLARWQQRYRALLDRASPAPTPASPEGGPGHTTHVSVVDGHGNAAAVTLSMGQGNGHLIRDTGIHMNNLMGEADLHPGGFHRWPAGTRLATNMCPTLLVNREGGVHALGSGGSSRIRTAILQVVSNLLDFSLPPVEAVATDRVHWEAGVLHAEVHDGSHRSDVLASLVPEGERWVPFEEPNMFFGGVHLAWRGADGTMGGTGDPRRSGAARRIDAR